MQKLKELVDNKGMDFLNNRIEEVKRMISNRTSEKNPRYNVAQKEVYIMPGTEVLNKQIELLFQFWDGKITEEEFHENKLFGISEEVDREAQKDRFY